MQGYSPLPIHRNARQAYRELRRYMEELREAKIDKIDGDTTAIAPSFIGKAYLLYRTSHMERANKYSNTRSASATT